MHSDLLMYLLGGGMVSLIIGIATLRTKIRKVVGETEELNLQNTQSATHILIENIVEPLKKELYATRKEFNDTKREMQLLRQAIESAHTCDYHLICPVLEQLREQKRDDSKRGKGHGEEAPLSGEDDSADT